MSPVRAQASVDVDAIEHNCRRLGAELRDGVALCAVVKADGYGHGALQSARAALAGGASWLAVASAAEAEGLRQSGLREVPVLVMGALSGDELARALAAGADVTLWHERDLRAVEAAGGGRVHVKLDSGMGRLGTRDPAEASRVAAAAAGTPGIELAGVMTHFATADELDDEGFFARQLQTFGRWAAGLKAEQPELVVHAANSAALLRDAATQFDMVRCGIAVYGLDPFGEDARARDLRPALSLRSYVAEVKLCRAGESVGYGRRFVAAQDTHIGVLPIGYGDGVRRGLSNNGAVLVAGRRRPLVGTVSMDNVTVDLGGGADAGELLGAEAVVIGRQGAEEIAAEEIAARLDTINYEVTCGLTPRVPRSYFGDGARAGRAAARSEDASLA
jgi:alanine racemase